MEQHVATCPHVLTALHLLSRYSLLLPPAAVVLGLGGGVVAGLVLGPGLVGVLAQAVIQLQADTVLYLLRYIYNISTYLQYLVC